MALPTLRPLDVRRSEQVNCQRTKMVVLVKSTV